MNNPIENPAARPFTCPPGVSEYYFQAAGCAHVGEGDCIEKYGFQADGIVIPFHDLNGQPIMDQGRPFVRVRLHHVIGERKYHQRPGSDGHIYIPTGFSDLPKQNTLIFTDDEFKAAVLVEAGCAAIGLCAGAARRVKRDNGLSYELNDELAVVLLEHKPARVILLGNTDDSLSAQFAIETARLQSLLCDVKRFPFLQSVSVTNPPIFSPQGIDDCRAALGDGFQAWLDQLLAEALELPATVTAGEIFCDLLQRDLEDLKKLLAKGGHVARRARITVLQSAHRLWKKTGVRLELKPLLAELFDVKQSTVAGLVNDAGSELSEELSATSGTAKDSLSSAFNLADVEPWQDPVDGPQVLDATSATFSRYLALPPGAADAMALWVLHTHAVDAFEFTPRLNVTSPEKRCGKTTTRDILALLVQRPLPTENLSAPVLFRVVEASRPTVLADEYDSWLHEGDELRGMFNAGHKRGAQALRCAGDSHDVRGFRVFAPAVLCGIGPLPGTLHDRSIIIRLERAKPGELRERFDSRRASGVKELCRKLARWALDNFKCLENCDPRMPDGAFNRVADNWRPLFAIAEIVGGDWPQRAVDAFVKLTSTMDADAQGIGIMLLADLKGIFDECQSDRIFSKHLVGALNDMIERPWPEAKHGKPISETWLARRLRPFGISPRTLRIGRETRAKGYDIADFADAFERYLSDQGLLSVTP
jgi:hypothetical protein